LSRPRLACPCQLRNSPEQIVDPIPFVNRLGRIRYEARHFLSGHHFVRRFILRGIFLGDGLPTASAAH